MNLPVDGKNRVIQVDIVRGFALFGVLLVNLTMIDATIYTHLSSPFLLKGIGNQLSAWAIHVFASGKFYTLFSMLFGLSFYLFMNKSNQQPVSSVLFVKRLIFLFFLGCMHLVFVWYGDILLTYAVTGAILLMLHKRSDQSLMRTAVILLILISVLYASFSVDSFHYSSDGDSSLQAISLSEKEAQNYYSQSSYAQMVQYRFNEEIPLVLSNLLIIVPKILALFIFGYLIGRKKIFTNLEANMPKIVKIWTVTGILSLISIGLYTAVITGILVKKAVWIGFLADELLTFMLAVFYMTSLIRLYANKHWKKPLTLLKYPGQMALTNYLVQTITVTTFINGYGAGWFGKIEYWQYVPIAIAFFTLQIFASRLWLMRFKQGPVEWVWRKFTYMKIH